MGRLGREAPMFRTCGVVGFYAALVALLAAGLIRELSLLSLAVVALVCATSFFGWALLRRKLTGRETLVLLEHVWIALGCSTVALLLLGEPVLASLDAVAIALAVFLAAGRIGCTLVGCCHGRPSRLGISYPQGHVADGFPSHLVGVRLFPVALFEAASLLAIAAFGLVALPFAHQGAVLSWYLAAYAIVRFGLEAARGDSRPEFAGISVNRWMCLGELAVAFSLSERELGRNRDLTTAVSIACLVVAVGVALAFVKRIDSRRILSGDDVEAARTIAESTATARYPDLPAIGRTPAGVVVGASPGQGGGRHLSFSTEPPRDLPVICQFAALVAPRLDPTSAALGDNALHVLDRGGDALDSVRWEDLYGAIVRAEQAGLQPAPTSARRYFGG
jgi:Prolipoprotein diacylglyceryl transferase